jgi:hypothetical protein
VINQIASELLAVAAQPNLPRIDESLYLSYSLQPGQNYVANSALDALHTDCPVKRRQALLMSNLSRDSRVQGALNNAT